jgi:acyl-coenzyme A synthetase/AMP-(fatty) acid ligase
MKTGDFYPLTDRPAHATIAFSAAGTVSVAQFLEETTRLSQRLPERRYVINLFSDRYQYLLGFCAAAVANQCTLMPPNRLPFTMQQLMEEYGDCYVLGDGELPPERRTSAGALNDTMAEISADQLCAIAFTSGSTGRPKANPKYWRTLRAGTRSNVSLLLNDFRERLNLLATVPPQHMWGMEMSVLLPLLANVAVSYRTPFFPQDIADALATLPEPRALVSSPVHLATLLKSGVAMPPLARIFTATAPLSEALARDLEQRFTTVVTDVFGCSETGVLAARNPSRDSCWQASDVFDLLNRKDGTLIRADHLPGDVRMPDIIEAAGRHRFRWIGRHQDMINIAGKRGSLADLNQRLNAMPGVTDGIIFMPERSERLAALVVAPALTVADILGYLKSHLDPVFLPRPVYLVPQLPRQETGKLALEPVLELFTDIHARRGQAQATGSSG